MPLKYQLIKKTSIWKQIQFEYIQIFWEFEKSIINNMKQSRSADQQVPQQTFQSKQKEQQNMNPKNRPRPPIDPKDKDEIKKKRKLLSFEQQIQEASPAKNQKIKRNDDNETKKKKHELGKHSKQNIKQDLKTQYLSKIQKLKDEMFEVDYSYWDGPLVIKKLKKRKKETIKNLAEYCRLQLIGNFQSLASLTANDLLLVIKDSIIPHSMTIADVQALELKTAKGDLLLNFKNVKIKDLSLSVNMEGPVRIIERSKYEKNILIYPFNTWKEMNID